MIRRLTNFLTVLAAISLLLASNAWGFASYMQDQPLYSGKCGEYAASNLINFLTGAHTTGEKIYKAKRYKDYHTAGGASYHEDGRDLMVAIAGRPYYLNVEKFQGGNLWRGFRMARQVIPAGGAVIMLTKKGKLTGGGHFVMGYRYDPYSDSITVSDSNRKNPDKAYPVSWLLNSAKGHVVKLWVYT